jgi:hypothetical protein
MKVESMESYFFPPIDNLEPGLSNCDIRTEQKISLINKTK